MNDSGNMLDEHVTWMRYTNSWLESGECVGSADTNPPSPQRRVRKGRQEEWDA